MLFFSSPSQSPPTHKRKSESTETRPLDLSVRSEVEPETVAKPSKQPKQVGQLVQFLRGVP